MIAYLSIIGVVNSLAHLTLLLFDELSDRAYPLDFSLGLPFLDSMALSNSSILVIKASRVYFLFSMRDLSMGQTVSIKGYLVSP